MPGFSNRIVTQIGSLPYEDIKEAVSYSLRHDIPFLPELPRKGDAMLEYIKNPGGLSCLEEFKKHHFSIVKIQCVGPATLILAGYNRDEAVERVYKHISQIINGLCAEKVILFLDEPALGQVGFNYKEMWDAIFGCFDVIRGIHTCGNMNWDELFESNIDMISFDASQFDITGYGKYRSGKRIAWGIEKKENIKDFQAGDILTLPCGMGSPKYSVEDCEARFNMLKHIAEEVIRDHG